MELINLEAVMLCSYTLSIKGTNFFWCTFSATKGEMQNLLKMGKLTNRGNELGKMVAGNGSLIGSLRLNSPACFRHYIQQPTRRSKHSVKVITPTNFKEIYKNLRIKNLGKISYSKLKTPHNINIP